MKGFLEKRRQTLKFHWRLYKFVLDGSVLSYYKMQNEDGKETEKEGILWGKINLRYVQSVRKAETISHNFPFEVVLYNGKTIILSAQSEAQRTEWLQALWKVMHLSGQEERNSRPLTSELHRKDYMTHSSDEDNCEDRTDQILKPKRILPRARLRSDLCVTSEKESVKMSVSQNRKHASLGSEQTSVIQDSCNSVHSYEGMPSPTSVISSTKISDTFHNCQGSSKSENTASPENVMKPPESFPRLDATLNNDNKPLHDRKAVVSSDAETRTAPEASYDSDECQSGIYDVPRSTPYSAEGEGADSTLGAYSGPFSRDERLLIEDTDKFIDDTFNGITFNRQSQLILEDVQKKLGLNG